MKKNMWLRLGAVALSALLTAGSIPAAAAEAGAGLDAPEMKYRPYARWWLAEGSHTDETLRESIKELYDAGYGGVEFVTLMSEAEYLDDATYGWGSPEWVHDTKVILEECNKYGMSASMTGGTYWATTNLPATVLTPDDEAASKELGYTLVTLPGEEGTNTSYEGELPLCALPGDSTKQDLVSVVAGKVLSWEETETQKETNPMTGEETEVEVVVSKMMVDTDSLTVVTDQVTEENGVPSIHFEAEDSGDYCLFAFYTYGTSESYTASVAGVQYTVNYFDPVGVEAVKAYWDETVLTDEIQELIDQMEECDLYMDSLELATMGEDSTTQLWCKDMLSEFSSRRGYELERYLPLLIRETPDGIPGMGKYLTYVYDFTDSAEIDAKKLRDDFFQTETELYEENCLQPLTEWLHGKNMSLRAEPSYGKTFEVTQTVDSIDYLETESFEFAAEIDLFRNFSGAAHLFGKRLSSETGASIFGNYKWNNGYYRQIDYMQFASDIQKTVVHGYSGAYGPEQSTVWPGFEGMTNLISERFNRRQPGFVDYPQVNLHLTRLQKALEQGVPQVDIGILRSDYYLNNLLTGVSNNGIETNRIYNHQAYFWQDMQLQDAGYTYEYFSPYLLTDEEVSLEGGLVNKDGVAYQALIVMEDEMPLSAAEALLAGAKQGLPVLFVNNVVESVNNDGIDKVNTIAASTTGSNDGKDEELLAVVEEIKALDNVRTVESEADAMAALEELGVAPRARFAEPNENLLTVLRKGEEESYLYVYNYRLGQEGDFEAAIEVEGDYSVYAYDTWSGKVSPVAASALEGRTSVPVSLAAGDTALFVLKEEAATEGAEGAETEDAEENTIEVTGWTLSVDSFTPGEMLTREEDNPDTGVHTKEVTFETNHETLDAGTLEELLPWKDIEALGENVSGIGTYTASFTLPEDFDPAADKALFKAGSFLYGTASLEVNGQSLPINMDSAKADITEAAVPGENTIRVQVTSSLRNAARTVPYLFWLSGGFDPGADDYGMVGDTCVTVTAK